MAVMESDRASPERELPDDQQLGCSVGIMAYNEEANIGDAIESILDQRLRSGQITELIVVASGCEDRTAEIVAGFAPATTRVRLIDQERREGKASAINLFIAEARTPVLIMVSGDVLVNRARSSPFWLISTIPRSAWWRTPDAGQRRGHLHGPCRPSAVAPPRPDRPPVAEAG